MTTVIITVTMTIQNIMIIMIAMTIVAPETIRHTMVTGTTRLLRLPSLLRLLGLVWLLRLLGLPDFWDY